MCLSFILFVDLVISTETWIFADKMKKNHIILFTPSLFTWSIYEIIYAALFKDCPKKALFYMPLKENNTKGLINNAGKIRNYLIIPKYL